RSGEGLRHGARAGLRRHGGRHLSRPDAHGAAAIALRRRARRRGRGADRMKAGLSQSTQLKQELKINPRLYQAMDLLYMPLLDLQQHLKQELLNNPFLDMVEPEDEEEETEEEASETETAPAEEKNTKDEIDWEEILLDCFDAGGRREEHEEREYYEPVTVDTRDLSDHLLDQMTLLDLTPRQQLLAH